MNKMLVAAALAAALTGCSSTPKLTEAERLALYQAHAGAEVRSFRMWGRLDGWTPLGNRALVVWTRPQEAWLLDLMGPCQDLDYATAIALTSNTSQVYARFDSVMPLGSMVGQVGRIPCRIGSIRPLDTKALKQAREQLREAQATPRPQETPDGASKAP